MMEALKLKTLEDLFAEPEERLELIGGEVVRRPMARFSHGMVQSRASNELGPMDRPSGPDGGWWIATEISVAYSEHDCPCHDLAGWRRRRLPSPPQGVIDLPPDWVCEIVSPGHERKDTLVLPLLLKRHQVPYYWLIWPEEQVLVAHELRDGHYAEIETLEQQDSARIPPFESIELDLRYMLGAELLETGESKEN